MAVFDLLRRRWDGDSVTLCAFDLLGLPHLLLKTPLRDRLPHGNRCLNHSKASCFAQLFGMFGADVESFQCWLIRLCPAECFG